METAGGGPCRRLRGPRVELENVVERVASVPRLIEVARRAIAQVAAAGVIDPSQSRYPDRDIRRARWLRAMSRRQPEWFRAARGQRPESNTVRTLHAAAVEHAGRALLLVGPAGAGKTTLALALARSGNRLLADDFAPIDSEGRVLACPVAARLDRGTLRRIGLSTYEPLRDWAAIPTLDDLGRRAWLVAPEEIPGIELADRATLHAIVFLRAFDSHGAPAEPDRPTIGRLTRRSRGRTVPDLVPFDLTLAGQRLAGDDEEEAVRASVIGLGRVLDASSAEVFRLEVGALESTLEVLQGMLGAAGSGRGP